MENTSEWPSPLNAQGQAPGLKALLSSPSLVISRQARFAYDVAKAFMASGKEVEGFQQPCGEHISIPLVLKDPNCALVAVYTYCDPWDQAALDRFCVWRNLFRAVVPEIIPILVVTFYESQGLRALEGIAQVIHLPLPGFEAEPEAPVDTSDHIADAKQNAARFCELTLKRMGVSLDLSEASLSTVEQAVDNIRESGVSRDKASGILFAAGCYLGEVLVTNLGGQWVLTPDHLKGTFCHWEVMVQCGDVGLNPIGKVFKQFDNGSEDSIACFYSVVKSQMSNQ